MAAFILPALNVRFGWSNIPPLVAILADGVVYTGYMIFAW
jgi:hypothetical protein